MTKLALVASSCCAIALLGTVPAGAAPATAAKWTLQQLPPATLDDGTPWEPPLSGVSCPTENLCVAVSGIGAIAYSHDPSGGTAKWHLGSPAALHRTCPATQPDCYQPRPAFKAVSCATENLCVAVTYNGAVYASTDPTGGAETWSPTVINNPEEDGATHLTAVSCTSPSFCATVSGGYKASGKVLVSTDPIAGQWQTIQLGSSLDLRGISCGTPSLCVAVAREGRIFVSTDPTGGAGAWRAVGTPGGPGDLEGVACVSTLLCAAGNLTGNVLTSTDPTGSGAGWSEANAGGSVQITGIACPTARRCVAVDNNGDVLTTTDPTGGAGSWHFENLVPFEATEGTERQPWNALFAASCATTSLCALVGIKGRIFTATDPFSVPATPGNGRSRKPRPRPRTILVFAEHFWKGAITRRHRIRARFRFYSPTKEKGFECKRDRGPYRPCGSPLRYWVGHGRHVLRVRAIGPTGLRGPAAIKRFRVRAPIDP